MDISRHQRIFILVVLLAATFLGYAPTRNHEFLDYDDHVYITESQVRLGLSSQGVTWAFTSYMETGNWHPLAWLSHLLDWELFGPNPGGHHLVNVGFHMINVLLVFVVLQRMTRATHHFSEVLRITPYSRKAQEKLNQIRSGSRTRR